MSKVKFLKSLQSIIVDRLEKAPKGSYTARLAAKGDLKVAQKLGEEAVELALASIAEDNEAVTAEAADLLYHMLLLLAMRDIKITDVIAELERRHEDAAKRF